MLRCQSQGANRAIPTMVHVTKMYSRPNASKFNAFGCGRPRQAAATPVENNMDTYTKSVEHA